MIVVRVELLSGKTDRVTELARLQITRAGAQTESGLAYEVRTLVGRSRAQLDRAVPQRSAKVEGFPPMGGHVWDLVAMALRKCGYGAPAKAGDA